MHAGPRLKCTLKNKIKAGRHVDNPESSESGPSGAMRRSEHGRGTPVLTYALSGACARRLRTGRTRSFREDDTQVFVRTVSQKLHLTGPESYKRCGGMGGQTKLQEKWPTMTELSYKFVH